MAKAIIWHRGKGAGVIVAATDEIAEDVGETGWDIGDQDESCLNRVKEQKEGMVFYEGAIRFDDDTIPIWLGEMRRATAADLKEMGLID